MMYWMMEQIFCGKTYHETKIWTDSGQLTLKTPVTFLGVRIVIRRPNSEEPDAL